MICTVNQVTTHLARSRGAHNKRLCSMPKPDQNNIESLCVNRTIVYHNDKY